MNNTQSFAATDVGCVRDHNEDYIVSEPEQGLWIVADGMGGHASGEVASQESCAAIVKAVKNGDSLVDAIKQAHLAVKKAVKNGKGGEGMGSTVVAAIVKDGYYEVAWVGDSRSYIWDSKLLQITKDHSFVQKLLDNGAITEEQAGVHPMRNVITQSLGAEQIASVNVDVVSGSLNPGEILLLCSDGLTGELDDQAIADILATDDNLESKVNILIRDANESGGRDNISVALICSNTQPSMSSTQPVDVDKINETLDKKPSFFQWLFSKIKG
jgi:PPM family protein phosphatase